MRISTQLKRDRSAAEIGEHIVSLESAGLDVVWVTESYGFDSPTLLGYLAARTVTLELGFGIMSVYSRTPTLIAQTALGLDEVTNGRARLGLGTSGRQVVEGWHGLPFDSPVQRTREVIEIVRQVARREAVHHDGIVTIPLQDGSRTATARPLKLINQPVRDQLPVYVAAMGQRNITLAAEMADGWLSYLFLPERAGDAFGSALTDGLSRRSADLGAFDLVAGGIAAIGDGTSEAMHAARAKTALYVGGMGPRDSNYFNRLACRLGYAREAELIQELYLTGRRDEAAAAVPAELVERTNLIGSAGFVRDRIQAYADSGVTTLDVIPIGTDRPAAVVEQIRAWL